MSTIEANISLDLPDGVNPGEYINIIRRELSKINGLDTKVNIIEVDDPLSLSPIHLRNLKV